MRIRLEELAEGALSLKVNEPPESFPVLTEMADSGVCQFLGPLKAALRAQRVGDIVEIKGKVSTAVRMDCGRCLQPFEMLLESSFDLAYSPKEPVPEPSGPDHEELELTAEDMGLIYYQGEEINLKNEIQEQVVLAFPLRTICKPACRGLCPKCGVDLNVAVCDCYRAPSDGKFAVLKNLKLKP
jgi:uncharacterized protein